jgi:FlaA1/EpsC-like NDP-sugar epimerase
MSHFVAKSLANTYVLLTLHASVFALTYFLAFVLRFDFEFVLDPGRWYSFTASIIWIVPAKLAVFYVNRHFHDIWYYASAKNLQQLIVSSCVGVVLIFAIKGFFLYNVLFPRSIPVLDAILTVGLIGGLRLSLRIFRDEIRPRFITRDCKITLLVGANHEGGKLAHSIHSYPELKYRIIGFVTIHPEKVRMLLGNIPVLGHLDDIRDVAKKHQVTDILVIAGILSGPKLRELSENCRNIGLNLRIIPQIENRLGNQFIPIRDINIDDLLKRDPIRLDDSKIRELVKGRRVLVTGAGGSIGAEICRQLVRYQPSNLLILGRGENRIFFLEKELREMPLVSSITPIIADVTNQERMTSVFEEYRPEVIFHAAAHKHVPLMEANVPEAIRNNIYGTQVVANLADEYESKTFVLVSTDKAVNPTSIMGTTKHIAERYVHAMSQVSSTQFIVTRFGNVLGSTGSVVPIFQDQIRRGGPITITDERMTRFFMTIPEASQLVL